MYTGDTSSTVSQGNTLNTIQELLKNKEKCQVSIKSFLVEENKDKGILNHCCTTSDFSKSQNFDTKSQASPDHVSNSSSSQENLDQQKDFNYSQKLFHIADGNLYSIFSPIQGRSYGMKPSFLRKQKYTVQECHSRGRKNLRKGLKFHNFLPSESVTSEKDNRYLSTKWKVHSECRLREEHGTKQITISNWSQSILNPPPETVNFKSELTAPIPLSTVETVHAETSLVSQKNHNSLSGETKSNVNDPYDFNLNSLPCSSENEYVYLNVNKPKFEVNQKSTTCSSIKKDSLDSVLNSLLQKSPISEKNNWPEENEIINKVCHKHRRKPVQTRRIVPYVKYLSIIEENEVLPLDLSSKCSVERSPNANVPCDNYLNASGKSDVVFARNTSVICDENVKNTISNYIHSDNSLMSNISNDKLLVNTSLNRMMQTSQITGPDILYPFNKNLNFKSDELYPLSFQNLAHAKIDLNTNSNVHSISTDKSYKNIINQTIPNNSQFSVQKSFVKEVQSKPRRRNQRSVIKQKLEDTFRQNGFLVKTKQVSDGEATFCKFRQLRKYTRYYLKSLEQHLPDEFHKMWKGFLPPKTVLPPVLGPSEPSDEGM